MAAAIILSAAALVISYISKDHHYYLTGILVMVLIMIPFFVSFEGRKPDAGYLALLAVMTVIAIVSRVAFMWAPSFKPMAGIIIITAVVFGSESGFMCGALSMLASNIIFGQGPWTLWQMFCYGMIGFVAGLLGKSRILSERHAIRSAVISFVLVFFMSMAVLDTYSVLFAMNLANAESFIAIYLAGMIPNFTNALASAICVFLLIKPISAAACRIITKYGVGIK